MRGAARWDGLRHLARIVEWRPVAVVALASLVWVASTARPTWLHVATAGAAVAAACAYLVDDPGAATVASSPTTLVRRRVVRVGAVTPLLGAWAIVVVLLANLDPDGGELADLALQLVTFVAVAVAAASWAARLGHLRGGISGVVAVLAVFGSGFLPGEGLPLIPPDPTHPAAARRLTVALVLAVVALLAASADPARRLHPDRRWRSPVSDREGRPVA